MLDHFGPDDIKAFWVHITSVFENGVQMGAKLMQSVNQPTREAYMTVREQLLAEGREQGLRQGLEQGRVIGRAEAVLDVLEQRQLDIPARVREQVLATRDEHRLRGWLTRVLTVASAEELLATGEPSRAPTRASNERTRNRRGRGENSTRRSPPPPGPG